jgi:hypothetical protein
VKEVRAQKGVWAGQATIYPQILSNSTQLVMTRYNLFAN